MAETIKIATTETGGTWGRLANWLSVGLRRVGFEVELLKRGGEIPESAYRVDSGEADLSITTTFGARAAFHGKTPYAKQLKIRGIAEIQYPVHWFVNMVRADTGLLSFEDLVEKKLPLQLCLPTPGMLVSYPVMSIFKLYGIDPYTDIPQWGGKIITDFSPVPRLLSTGQAQGLFRENSPFRYDVSQLTEMKFFQLTEEQVQKISDELCIKVGLIKAGTYRNQQEEILTLDAEGFTIFARNDLADDVAYRTARAIDHETQSHHLSTSVFYSPRFAVNTGAPLHDGAARYYCDGNYLPN